MGEKASHSMDTWPGHELWPWTVPDPLGLCGGELTLKVLQDRNTNIKLYKYSLFSVLWLVPNVFRRKIASGWPENKGVFFFPLFVFVLFLNGRKYIFLEFENWTVGILQYLTTLIMRMKLRQKLTFICSWIGKDFQWKYILCTSRSGKWGKVLIKVMQRMLPHKEVQNHICLHHTLLSDRIWLPRIFLLSVFPKSWKNKALYHQFFYYTVSRLYAFKVPILVWNKCRWSLPWLLIPSGSGYRSLLWGAVSGLWLGSTAWVSESLHETLPHCDRVGEGKLRQVHGTKSGGRWRITERQEISGAVMLRGGFGEPTWFLHEEGFTAQLWTSMAHTKSTLPECGALNPCWVRNHSLIRLQGTGSALSLAGSLSKHAVTQSSLTFGVDALCPQPKPELWVAVPSQDIIASSLLCFLKIPSGV